MKKFENPEIEVTSIQYEAVASEDETPVVSGDWND